MKSQAQQVREFTIAAGQHSPETPREMSKMEVMFISKMIIDEVLELMATVASSGEAKQMLVDMIEESKDIPETKYKEGEEGRISKIADQADALVDIEYYMLNCACKTGVNLASVFKCVHAANMAKRDPETGKFLKRDDGKIIKPLGWESPDIEYEIQKQIKEGSWND